ncbi:MAG: hypothetical protein EOP84_20975 [Verrucomicrobiaceae bacterium]|nr:MAG: hypothetical protein EOP84_20975 [Verrucomicrobiaceae bacterium]
MPTYSVRTVLKWNSRPTRTKQFLYEERITVWNAESLDAAIDQAEKETGEYAAKEGFEAFDFFQGYWMFDEIGKIPQGTEVFSLLRESDLPPQSYIDTFFDTGTEREGDYGSPPEEGAED